MPSISNISFSVRFDFTGVPTLILTDTSTNGLTSTRVASFNVTQPDGYTRQGDILNPDMPAGVTTFSLPLRLDSSGDPQCGTYTVVMTVSNAGYDDTDFTRTWISQYKPVTIVIGESFDVFTPNLSVRDNTSYSVSNYNSGSVSRSWNISSTPTGALTGTGVTQSLVYGGQYYSAVYSISLTSSLLYTHQVYSWFTVDEGLSKSYSVCIQDPPEFVQLVEQISELKLDLDNAINTCQTYDNIKKDFEYAQSLLDHIIDKLKVNDTANIYKDLNDLLSVLANNQIPACNPTNSPIPAYNIGSLNGVSWGDIVGLITNQTDLVNYIASQIASTKYAANVGNGSATSFALTHGLNSLDVEIEVFENLTGETVYTDVVRTSSGVVTVSFASAPTSNQYRVVIMK